MAFVDYEYFFYWLWDVAVDHIIPLVALLLMAILVPRLGRLTIKIIEGRLDEEEESTKARLALLGALVYVVQIIAYFIIVLFALSNLGVPPLGAAVPATIVSAAVGFGAQSIIGDFLAGFFIISERQFGVGDYVSFDGTSTATEGTVVALTLRATKVRTPSGEVVMIPNGSAGVVTNFSQDWSRAVVNFDVPVRSGENLDHIQKIIEDTSNSAVTDSSIAEDVAGEIEILPATSLTAPTAAGQPWKVNFRILVVVNPARQWAVERGIRSALLNVFWDHFRTPFESPQPGLDKSTQAELAGIKEQKVASPFDAPSTSTSTPPSFQGADAPQVAASESPTEVMPVRDSGSSPAGPNAEETQDAAEAAEKAERTEEELAPSAKDDGPGRPAKTATFDGTDAEDTDDTSTTAGSESDDDKDAEKLKGLKARRDFWRTDAYDKRWKKIMSFGGRIRVSTTGLILALLFTGGLALASSNPEDGNAGILSPAYWRDRAETTVTETTEPEVPLKTSENEPTVAPEIPEPSEQPLPSEEFQQDDTQLNNEEEQEQATETSSAPTQQNPGTQNQQPTRTPTPSEDAANQDTQGLTDTGATSQSEAVQVPEPAEELVP